MNTRIQVERSVTEEVTGVDLVQQQILLATGGATRTVELSGHAIECGCMRGTPDLMPSTGVLRTFQPPRLFGVRMKPATSKAS